MSLQFRHDHYSDSESDREGPFTTSNLQALFHRYTYRSLLYLRHECRIRGVSPFTCRDLLFYRNLDVIAVSPIVWFALIGFADCVHCASDIVSLKWLPSRDDIDKDNVRKYGKK